MPRMTDDGVIIMTAQFEIDTIIELLVPRLFVSETILTARLIRLGIRLYIKLGFRLGVRLASRLGVRLG